MRGFLSAALVLGVCLVAWGGAARALDAGARARAVAAEFNKEKHKVKEKRGVRLEVFVEVRAEPALRGDAAEYTGTYESEPDYTFDLRVAADGSAEGGGTEPAPEGSRRFTLRGARVSGALLTGTKVYEGGATEPLEAAFLNLNVRHSPTSSGTNLFGLGVVFDPPKDGQNVSEIRRLFYAPQALRAEASASQS